MMLMTGMKIKIRDWEKSLFVCVDVKIFSVLRSPQEHQFVYEKIIRRALVNRFPFSIYFVDQEDAITVFAILHQHRTPESWKARV